MAIHPFISKLFERELNYAEAHCGSLFDRLRSGNLDEANEKILDNLHVSLLQKKEANEVYKIKSKRTKDSVSVDRNLTDECLLKINQMFNEEYDSFLGSDVVIVSSLDYEVKTTNITSIHDTWYMNNFKISDRIISLLVSILQLTILLLIIRKDLAKDSSVAPSTSGFFARVLVIVFLPIQLTDTLNQQVLNHYQQLIDRNGIGCGAIIMLFINMFMSWHPCYAMSSTHNKLSKWFMITIEQAILFFALIASIRLTACFRTAIDTMSGFAGLLVVLEFDDLIAKKKNDWEMKTIIIRSNSHKGDAKTILINFYIFISTFYFLASEA